MASISIGNQPSANAMANQSSQNGINISINRNGVVSSINGKNNRRQQRILKNISANRNSNNVAA
jgi:hypothetical protein